MIDEGSTAIVLRIDFIESNSLFRELVIDQQGEPTIKTVKSLAIKLGKATNQVGGFYQDTEFLVNGYREMNMTIYGKDNFEKECRIQDEIFKKSFEYSLTHFGLPKPICPSVLFCGMFDSSKLEFLVRHINPEELKFIQYFLSFGEPRYTNTILLMPFIEDRMLIFDFIRAFFEGTKIKNERTKRIEQSEYVTVLSNFLFTPLHI
jgi:hypothetical protein